MSVFCDGNPCDYMKLMRGHIENLTSGYMCGRFVQDSGVWRAGSYIANYLEKCGLKVIIQPFTVQVNVIEDAMVVADGDTLIPGVDFLISPSSSSFDTTINMSDSTIPVRFIGNAREGRAGGDTSIIFLTKDTSLNLIWSVSTKQRQGIRVLVRREKVNTLRIKVRASLREVTFWNIMGVYEGGGKDYVLFSAHYDHIGKLGSSCFYGASDNASGVSMVMVLAEYTVRVWKPKKNVVFLFTAGEELGLLGSQWYVVNPTFPLKKTKVVNLDIVGGGDNGIVVVGAYEHRSMYRKVKKYARKLGVNVKKRRMAPNSDHYPFHVAGVPAIFIYTDGGAPCYHNPCDTLGNLSLSASGMLVDIIRYSFLR